ncbi:MAG: glycosyltransferase family 4 protein [Symplocastrum torsivum CPER-KK1]|jgi:glycosyltransferase involved in cell wall biosynthesis|uniref:Glycosyltransferase family 4 protein n=1 Tax=Symplocastrum torsivum CPER-KK1 TaxID=450513 RepID=A0A951PI02_9CYAN|nr:glycosyltransferase family 4 protein [Symplocastrum torsivum CPER-KK1]
MKVVYINNYEMDVEQWKNKAQPGQHFWGATHLHQHNIDVEILPHTKYVNLQKLSTKIKILGDLDQQLRLLFRQSQYDVIYSACQYNTFFLAILRSIGLFPKPVIPIIHHPMKSILNNKLIFKILYGGHDQFICLHKEVKKQLEDKFEVPVEKLHLLEWGPDLHFYDQTVKNQQLGNEAAFILSAGKTRRDFDTLVQAFIDQNYPLRVYCTGESAPTISGLPPNISIQYNHPTKDIISYVEMLAEYRKAYAVAIPLKNVPNSLIGLTSLIEAMAMSKAVIMTRNNYIDIDIEKEGIGIWVEPGDVQGWQQAVSYLFAHPSETKEMGNRARRLCEQKYNLEIFSSKLASILKSNPSGRLVREKMLLQPSQVKN